MQYPNLLNRGQWQISQVSFAIYASGSNRLGLAPPGRMSFFGGKCLDGVQVGITLSDSSFLLIAEL